VNWNLGAERFTAASGSGVKNAKRCIKMEFPIFEFIEKNLMIKNEPLKLYPYQRKFLTDQSDRRIVLKARQVGFSTLLALESLIRVINPEKTVLLVSVSDRQSQELMNKVSYFLRQVEKFTFPAKYTPTLEEPHLVSLAKPEEAEFVLEPFIIVRETKTEKIFKSNSRIISLPNSPQTVCGYQADYCYIDEFAKFDKDRDIMNAIEPSLSRGGKLTLNSTPFGKRGLFYNIWEDAKKKGYSVHKIPWTACPDKNYQKEIGGFKRRWDPINFAQEYEMKFISEALSFFPYSLTMPCVNHKLVNVHKLDSPNYTAMGVDFGQKSSQSVAITVEKTEQQIEDKTVPLIIVKNITDWKLLTKYKKIESHIKQMHKDLNPTIIRVDQTGLGITIMDFLRSNIGAAVQGIKFTAPIKERMATDLRNLFENKQIHIPDNRKLLHQLNNLERNVTDLGTVRFMHSKGEHDDYVWALCLACFGMTRPRPFFGVR